MPLNTRVAILAALGVVSAASSNSIMWTLGDVDTDCDTTCEAAGGLCDESAWPTSIEQWQAIADETDGLSCTGHGAGNWKFNPAICTGARCQGYCFWQGRGKRCSGGTADYPSPIAKRACPCQIIEVEAHEAKVISSSTPVYSMVEERQFQGDGECFDADFSANTDLPLAGSPYTIEAWVEPEEVQPDESFGIVGWGVPAYSQLNGLIFFRGSHSLRNIWWQNDLQAYLEKPLADGKYHHVAATWDGSMQRILVDFREVASRSARGYNVQSMSNFCVGVAWHQDGSRAHFRGKIKGLKIWSFARNFDPDTETAEDDMETSKPFESTMSEPKSSSAQRVIVDSFEPGDSQAYFGFEAPTSGCYMVEERHPHVDGDTAVPLAVDFGKGLQAHGEVDYADGRHGQWNYLASLLFFDGFPSGVLVSQELTGGSNAHSFRFSLLGSSCHSPEAKVQHARLEVKADHVMADLPLPRHRDRVVAFKASLEAALTSALELAQGRMSIMHASFSSFGYETSASVVADIMVRPVGALHGRRLIQKERHTAEEIVGLLEENLQADSSVGPDGLSTRICKLVGATAGCTVAVKMLGTMSPRVHFGVGTPHTPRDNTPDNAAWPSNSMAVTMIISAAVVLCAMLLMVTLCRRGRAKKSPGSTQKQELYFQTETITACSNKEDMEQTHQGCDETASTATPVSLEEGLTNLQDTSDIESRGDSTGVVVAI